jgi:hypothetical protein
MRDEAETTNQTGRRRTGRTRRWGGVLVLGGTLALLGVAIARVSTRAAWQAPAHVGREAVELHPDGNYTHPAGFLMPAKAGPFERAAVTQYDDAGLNVSAGYNALVGGETPLPIVATLYVYPAAAGDDLDAYFGRLLGDIGRQHGGAKPELRTNILLGPRHFAGRYAVLGYEEPWGGLTQSIPLRSYVVVYRWKSWWVKWRATTPGPVDHERMRAIVDLTESLLPPEEDAATNAGK